MPDTHASGQAGHLLGFKHIPDQAAAFVQLYRGTIEGRNTRSILAPVLQKLRSDGYRLVGLEQTTNSTSMHSYSFARRTVLVVGNERTGLTEDILKLLDDVVEIPVYGLPHSFNAATAASMALYEYCRQFPNG